MPSIKLTEPVGVPLPEVGATVALSITLAPALTVEAEAVSVVLVEVRVTAVTVTESAGVEVLAAYVALP